MYRSVHIDIDRKHPMFSYFDRLTALSNNLYNATLFRMRQVMTGVKKSDTERQENEKEVLTEIERALPFMGDGYSMPTEKKWLLSYKFLNALFYQTENPDYFAENLPRQSAQWTIKHVTKDFKAFIKSCKSYRQDSSSYNGTPKPPRYKKKGSHCKIDFTNQDCVLCKDDKGKQYIKFPFTDQKLKVGNIDGRLKSLSAIPYYDKYRIIVIVDDGKAAPEPTIVTKRVIAIDLGVDNFAAITNNIGEPCQLFKGGVIKSANQWYNKRLAEIVSEQTKGTTNKFKPTEASIALCCRRDNIIDDFMHKVAKNIVTWCINNEIDTVVIGENKGWKNGVNLGHVNNQNFVQIPFSRFKAMMEYLCSYSGIRLVFQEESYTSKASYRMKDVMPVYGEEGASTFKFSGRRCPTRYKGMYRKNGFRGLYKDNDGVFINSDLNGSANIGRKAFPELFVGNGREPDFTRVTTIIHPDYESAKELHKHQIEQPHVTSKAKTRRLNKKAACAS